MVPIIGAGKGGVLPRILLSSQKTRGASPVGLTNSILNPFELPSISYKGKLVKPLI
jgi:hypothetical protein